MKREYLILSGICSGIVGSVLYFTHGYGSGHNFTFYLLIPSLLTFVSMLGIMLERHGQTQKLLSMLPVGVRLLLMFFQLALVLYQFFMFVAWVTVPYREWPVAADIHFIGYFFLVGMVCSIIMLSRLAAPREAAGC
jgi:hypothetical protein